MANTYLQRTNTSATNTFTFSAWVKLCDPTKTANQWIFTSDTSGLMTRDSNTGADGGDEFHFYNSANNTNYYSGAKRRDISGWYHIVLSSNSGTGTLYVNGETDKTGIVVPTLSTSSNAMQIGRRASTGGDYFDGLMSHVHFIDGTAYNASSFGQTDATTGEWSINASPSVTYGSQGFFILKDGNSVTDQSGNSNNLTVGGGNLTKTEDNPSNVFATWNPLDGATSLGDSTITYGNNKFNSESGSNKCWARSTLGMTSGKYYFEIKVQTPSNNCAIGISDRPSPNLTTELGAGTYDYSYQSQNGESINNGTAVSYGNSYTTNDIVMCALDLDNNKLYFGKNGTWQDSGDPTSGSTGTGAAYSVTAPSSTNGGAYFFCGADLTGANTTRLQANFGNGYFGTTAVSSAGTNASGNGIFEYDVPTGYTALSTKGLNL